VLVRRAAKVITFAVALLWLAPALHAQFTFNETFSHTTTDQTGWQFGSVGTTAYTPTLTAGTTTGTVTDANGSGYLRMTNNQANESTYALLTTPIPSTGNNITIDLKYQMWTNQAQGADGLAIALFDATQISSFSAGAFGGSLGYAQKNAAAPGGADETHAGMTGGYFGLGVDAFGNFSNPTEGRIGGPGATPNAVALRGYGSGNGYTGTNYDYLAGTTSLAGAPYNLGTVNFTGVADGNRPVTDPNLTLAQRNADFRELVFNFNSANILTVSMRFGTTGTLTQVFTYDMSSNGIRPDNLGLAFTAGTGGSMQYTEIQGLSITTTTAPVGTIYYSNYAGDNKWGTGNNWGNSTTPDIGVIPANTANLVFSNHLFTTPAWQLTTAQNVDLQQNRTAASIQFDAPFNYTLQGYTLTLDNTANSLPTAITVTSAAPGGAHTIQSNVQLNSDLNVNINTNTALAVTGNIAAGSHVFTINNNGTVTFAGQITGSGTMTQATGSTGTTVISGDSSSTYTGNIVVQAGTLQLGASNVLNAATNLSLSTVTSSGTFNLANYNQTLGALTFASGGSVTTGTGVLTMAGTLTTNASATAATISGNMDLGAATRTFSVADGAATYDLNISANIAGTGGGINKTGNGTMLLSGNNSFTGANTLAGGTTIAASNTALGNTGTSTVSSGATLALQGGITLNSGNIGLVGTGYAGNYGALSNLSGNNTVSSNLVFNGGLTIGAASATQLTLNGAISQSSAGDLNTGGTGTIVLGGNNSYTGISIINSGATLVAAANNALGTTAGNTIVAPGNTLGFQGGINYSTAEPVTVNGTGVAGRNGAIDNISGNNTFAGPITLWNVGAVPGATIGAASGTQLTLNGAIGETGGVSALTVGGAGTVVLGNSNNYTGATTVNSGATLVAASNNALGTTAAGTTVASGGTLAFQGGITYSTAEAVTATGTGDAGSNGAIDNLSGNNSFSGAITLGAGGATVGAAGGTKLTLAGAIGAAQPLVKAGAGTVELTAANTYTGTTTINGGTLSLAGASGALAAGAGNITINAGGALTLDNTAANNANRLSATPTITLNNGATFNFLGNAAGSSTETIGTLTTGAGNNVVYMTSGATQHSDLTIGNLTQNGSATVTFTTDPSITLGAGATNAGVAGSPRVFLTQVSGVATTGTLAAPTALAGWILVNDSNGSSNFAEYTGGSGTGNGVRALSGYYVGAQGINVNDKTKSVLLTAASTLAQYKLSVPGPAANNGGPANGKVTWDSGLKITDAPLVDLNTDATYALALVNGGLIKSGATATVINSNGTNGTGGRITSGNGTVAITVDNAAGTLTNYAPIIDNPGGVDYPTGASAVQLTKAGPGLLVLGASNPFTGNVNINGGVLSIGAENNLGPLATAKTINFNGGTLNVSGNITANTAKTWTIAASNTGTFDINNGVSLILNNGGTNDVTSSATSQLIKTGLGTLQFANNNAGFLGSTLVNQGTLELDTATALGTGTTITLAGGTLSLKNNAGTVFSNNLAITADSTINTDHLSAGTGLNHTLGTLTIGTNTLTTGGANNTDLTFGSVTLTGNATFNTSVAGNDLVMGVVSGAGGSLTKSGAANLTLNSAATYGGATTVSAGTLYTNGTNYLPTGTALTVNGTLNTNNNAQTVASLSGSGTVTMGTGALTVGDGTSTNFSGVIGGSGAFTKQGTGTLTLSGTSANTLSSAFNVNSGTVILNKTAGVSATGSGSLTIGDGAGGANSAVVQLAQSNQIDGGSTAVTINTDGRLDLNGYTQTIGSLAGSGTVNLGAGSLTTGGSNTNTSYTGQIGGTGGSLTKTGTGTLTLSGNNNFTGAASVSQGIVQVNSTNALGTGAATVANNAAIELQGTSVTLGNSSLNITGTGPAGNGAIRNISGNNYINSAITLGGASTINISTGNLYLAGGVATNGYTLTTTGTGTGNALATGAITGTGGINKNGIGTLVLSNTGNTYNGTTAITAGSLQIGANNAGPASSAVTVSTGATLDVNNYTAAVGSLAGSGTVTLGNGTLTAGGNNSSTTFSGAIGGAGGGLTKAGNGTLILSGTNTYSGATTVNAGTLQLGANNVLASSTAVTISGGTFDVNSRTQTISSLAGASGSLSVAAGGVLTVSSSTSFSGSVTVSGAGSILDLSSTANSSIGSLTLGAGSTLKLGDNALAVTTLNITGASTIDFGNGISATLSVGTFNLGANTISVSNWVNGVDYFYAQNWTGATLGSRGGTPDSQVSFAASTPSYPASNTAWLPYDAGDSDPTKRQITPAPEPATYGAIFMGLSLLGLGLRRWRARSRP
jgi:autotransporter-associated beta strand protein